MSDRSYNRITLAALCLCATCGVCSMASRASAEETDGERAVGQSPTERSADAGMFLPLTMAPRTDSQRAFALALGGYDGARKSGLLEGTADATIFGPVAVRVGVLYTGSPETLRPTFGARVQALQQAKHFVDMSVGLFYRPEGFTEAEGEVEAVVAFGHRFGRLGTFLNLVYGQDPEAAERDAEIRLAALYAFSERLQAGLDGRLRFDLGSDEGKRRAEGEADWDVIVGPAASYALGPVAVVAQAGLSAVGNQSAKFGPVALGGLAGAF
jgi:hypothetical protein